MTGEKFKLQRAVISGASHAMKFKERNPRASLHEVIKNVTNNVNEIIEKLEEEL